MLGTSCDDRYMHRSYSETVCLYSLGKPYFYKMFKQANIEGIYEQEVHYENDEARMAHGAPVTPPRNDSKRQHDDINMHVNNLKTLINNVGILMKNTEKRLTTSLGITQAIIVVFFVTLVVLYHTNSMTMSSDGGVANPSQTNDNKQHAKSCYDLKQKQINRNGIYSIKPETDFRQIEVFCDMETSGGGWTLVASIHENDITMKCDTEDRWSKYVPSDRINAPGKTNWENKRTFGDVRQCTQSDYKNSAYYAVNANDVMIWHVPARASTTTMKSRAKLRYRTTNHFLQETGGNLKSLFDERYPLKVKSDRLIGEKRNDMIMNALVKNTASIRAILSDWYTYNYESQYSYRIEDSMLYSSYGNRIQFGTSTTSYGSFQYEQRIRLAQTDIVVDTKKSQPFLLVTAISNKIEKIKKFCVEVRSYRKQSDFIEELGNNITRDDMTIQYRALQFSNSYDPTTCEFHFVVFSKKWRSTPPKSFKRTYQSNYGTYRRNRLQIDGTPSNILIGYMLLTRSMGKSITTAQTNGIAEVILQAMSSLKDLFNEKHEGGLAVPVTFDRGSTSIVLETIPPYLRDLVEPGYLHFSVYNETGYPNAICPGVKINTKVPEYSCIGGLSDDITDSGTCGDFAGWAGGEADVILQNEATGLAHSQNDISSAILIFYR